LIFRNQADQPENLIRAEQYGTEEQTHEQATLCSGLTEIIGKLPTRYDLACNAIQIFLSGTARKNLEWQTWQMPQ